MTDDPETPPGNDWACLGRAVLVIAVIAGCFGGLVWWVT